MTIIHAPGLHNIPASVYHADPCAEPSLSASVAKLMLTRTPKHAWTAHPRLNPDYAQDHDAAFDLGSAAHACLLGDPAEFEIVDAPDWRSRAAQLRREEAWAANKIPLLASQWDQVSDMVSAARRQLADHRDARQAFLPSFGRAEQTLVWQEDGGIWCRARLDWMPHEGGIYHDYKTTGCADPDAFVRRIIDVGHDVQAAFYCRGLRALRICDRPEVRFVVQETAPPYPLCVIGLAPAFADLATHKVARAIEIWRECLRSDSWPAYPSRTCWVEPPAWH